MKEGQTTDLFIINW